MTVVNFLPIQEPIVIGLVCEPCHDLKVGDIVSLVFLETGKLVMLEDYRYNNRRVVFAHQVQLNA